MEKSTLFSISDARELTQGIIPRSSAANQSPELALGSIPFILPPDIRNLVLAGKELGEADNIVFGRSGSKFKEGAVGLLTGGVIPARHSTRTRWRLRWRRLRIKNCMKIKAHRFAHMKNPYQTLSSGVVYENKWMRVIEDTISHRDGKGVYAYIDKSPAVTIIALSQKNEIYLVGQWRYPIRKYSWELPMGKTDKKERPLTAARRELQEEVDLVAKNWTALGSFYLADGTMNTKMHVYLAQQLHDAPGEPDDTEYLKVKKVSIRQIEKMIKNGEIFDGPTIAAFYLFISYKQL